MEQVAPCLYIGGLDDAGDTEALVTHNITAVLKLTHSDPETPYPEAVTVSDHPMFDGPRNDFENFQAAVDRLTTFLKAGDTVLVHCSAGSSRSGAVAVAALARQENVSIDAELARIQDQKSDVEPHPTLLKHARQVVR